MKALGEDAQNFKCFDPEGTLHFGMNLNYICRPVKIGHVMKNILSVFTLLLFVSCGDRTDRSSETPATNDTTAQVVNIYTHRHYEVDKTLFAAFSAKTGIEVKVVKADADELMVKLETEGEASPCDLFFTADAARLVKAQNKNLLQKVSSPILEQNVPAHLRNKDGYWFAQTIRARILAYSKERLRSDELSTYEALADEKFKGKILTRSSNNVYNQSLLASIIEHHGLEKAGKWAEGVVKNFAREPRGNDRDQVKFIAAGLGDIAIVNTYYMGKMLFSDDPAQVEAANTVALFFPNQKGRGTHINISGAGVARHAPHKENAIRLLEFLSGEMAQAQFAEANYEYPVNPDVPAAALLQSWGTFKMDSLPLEKLGKQNAEALKIFDQAGWN